MTHLRKFLTTATDVERDRLAETAGTSTPYLYAIAGGHRHVKVELADRIEKASTTLSKRSKGRLPVVPRTALNQTCAACPFARACKSGKNLK